MERPLTTTRRTFLHAIFLGLLLAIGANALLYASKAANPLIVADGWSFLDTVVHKAADGHFALGDLFVKRGALDHSQPLRKLILLFHYRYFDLDFGIEALIGVFAAFINIGLFWLMVRPDDQRQPRHRVLMLSTFVALAAVYLSLNAPVTFNWPLLTLSYTSHFFVLVFLWIAWRSYRQPDWKHMAALALTALLMDVVADDTGLIATIAAVMSVALYAARERRGMASLRAAAAMLAGYGGYMVVRALLAPPLAGGNANLNVGVGKLVTGLLNHTDGLLGAIGIPLVASVAHRVQLRALLGVDSTWVEILIAVLVVAAHGWFWWKAWRGKANLPAFASVGLMLLFYGLVAGMLLARVSLNGVAYLWQPRYVLIYEWNLVALLLMALAQLDTVDATARPDAAMVARSGAIGRAVLACAVAGLLLLQLPLTHASWAGLKYVSAYQQRMAAQLGEIAHDPSQQPHACAPMLVVCRYGAQRRSDTIRFLQGHRLSVFSPAFRARNRLYPDAGLLPH